MNTKDKNLIERAQAVSTYSSDVDQADMLNRLVGRLTGMLYSVDSNGMISAEEMVEWLEQSGKDSKLVKMGAWQTDIFW